MTLGVTAVTKPPAEFLRIGVPFSSNEITNGKRFDATINEFNLYMILNKKVNFKLSQVFL
jgi:hypothetical protein